MPIEAGCVVCSLAGKDAGGFYAVVSTREGYVLLANGRDRLLERPKLKNVKHIRKTNKALELSGAATNKELRRALDAIRASEGGNQLV